MTTGGVKETQISAQQTRSNSTLYQGRDLFGLCMLHRVMEGGLGP
jgi:hypothetical protein